MPRSARFTRVLVLLQLFVLCCAPAAAAPVPIVDRSGAGSPPHAEGPSTACQLQPGAESPFAYFFDAPLSFAALAWRIPRQSCAQCAATNALNLRSATIGLRWASRPCVAHLRVSVVAAGGDAACPSPDTTRALCPPFEFTAVSGAENYEDFTIVFPADCCVGQDAFVLFQFEDYDVCRLPNGGSSGIIASLATAVACDEYVIIQNDVPGFQDWYSPLQGVGNSLWVQLAADCCAPTPARPRSWGSLKTLYR